MRKYKLMVLVAILLFVIPLTAVVSASNSPKTSPPTAPTAHDTEGEATTNDSSSAPIDVQADFGKLPLSFIPNVGQSDAKVQFQTHAYGGTVFFTDEEIVLALPASVGERAEKELFEDEELTTDKTMPMTVARLSFEKRERAAKIEGTEKLPGIVNYYRGSDPDNWFSGVPTYGGIAYENLYPGIDLHYNSEQGQLKSTFIVAPKVDSKQIRWRYKGAEDVSVDKSGQLHVALKMPEEFASSKPAILVEQAPIAWQEKNGEEVPVEIDYHIARDGSIGFKLGKYDRTKPLILDLTLSYSSYLGGSGTDYAFSNAVDSEGNLYVTGATFSPNFPTVGFSKGLNGSSDAFVSKLNPSGNTL